MVRKACQVVLIMLSTHAKDSRRRQRTTTTQEGGHAEQRCLYLQMTGEMTNVIRCVEHYESTLGIQRRPTCVCDVYDTLQYCRPRIARISWNPDTMGPAHPCTRCSISSSKSPPPAKTSHGYLCITRLTFSRKSPICISLFMVTVSRICRAEHRGHHSPFAGPARLLP